MSGTSGLFLDVVQVGLRALVCIVSRSMDANTRQTAVTGPTFEHAAANSFLAAQHGIRLRSPRTSISQVCRADYPFKNAPSCVAHENENENESLACGALI
jgi:hypothetical protein